MAKRKNTGLIVGALAALGVAGAAVFMAKKPANTGKLGCGCGGQTAGLAAAERMRAEAWRDGDRSWVDVTPAGGPRMRVTHQIYRN